MHTYRRFSNPNVWCVGYYDPESIWHTLSDHNSEKLAPEEVNYLNGGNSHVNTYVMEP